MTAVIRAFDDDRLDSDLAAILKLANAQEPTRSKREPITPLGSLHVSRRASATIVASLTFALVASAGLVLLNYKPATDAGSTKGERSVSALIPAVEVKAPAETAIASSTDISVEHRHGRANESVGSRQAYEPLASTAEVAGAPSSSATNVATADAPPESAPGEGAFTSTPGLIGVPPEAPNNTSGEPAEAGEQDATNAEVQLAAKRARRDSVAAIRALRRQ